MISSLSSILTALAILAAAANSSQPTTSYPHCDRTFSCGTITNVTYPFTGGDRPSHCGPPEFALTCRNNIVTELTDGTLSYRVLQLHQIHRIIILSRSDMYINTCPESGFHNTTLNRTLFSYDGPLNQNLTMFYGCNPSATDSPFTCSSSRFFNQSNRAGYWIGPVPSNPGGFWGFRDCTANIVVKVLRAVGDQETGLQLSLVEAVRQGFSVSYSIPHEDLCLNCSRLGGLCGFDSVLAQPVCICGDRPCAFDLTLPAPSQGSKKGLSHLHKYVIIGPSIGVAIIATFFLICIRKQYRLCEQDQGSNQNIEKLILNHGSLAPKRYNHNEIKKITKSFSNKIGQGGYGIVYKGKLPGGQPVAVKVLTETGEHAEDFINEVSSISRTSHVNIVNLLGFCYERKKRALVYEFMPNKSLDNFISNNNKESRQLEWGEMYGVAVGVARGLEYLHRGCNTRIIHFDIKPQNILLDEDMSPKISDFGLAKLFQKKQSMISMLGARGTIGYIAPEVFSRSFGVVSHKSDVYSYGMMLLEMVGAKKDIEMEGARASESFHDKIYEHVLSENRNLNDHTADDKETSLRKMLLTGIWCIQIAPLDRPSMTKVVEMLEGTLQSIQIPPKPFFYSPKLSPQSSSSFSATRLEIENSNEG